MFANMRLVQGRSNHALGVPTGLLQAISPHIPNLPSSPQFPLISNHALGVPTGLPGDLPSSPNLP